MGNVYICGGKIKTMEQNNNIITSNELKSELYKIQDFIDLINELNIKLFRIKESVKEYNWNSKEDSRMLFIIFIGELNVNTILQLSILYDSIKNLEDIDWYKRKLPMYTETFNNLLNIEDFFKNRINSIFDQINDNFFLSYFFEFETRIRSVVRNIGNIKHPTNERALNGNENFNLIFKGLIENYLNLDKEEYDVLKIYSVIRNTIHNSGIYFSPKNEDSPPIKYKNNTYNFLNGKPVNFLNLELKKIILLDLLELFSKILNNQEIKVIELIKDPIADIKFL